MGEEIESGLKKGWYIESSSSGKRFTNKKDKEHAPEVNMTYVQKTPAQAPKLQFTTQQATSYERQGQQDSCQQRKPRQFTPLPGTLSQVIIDWNEELAMLTDEQDPELTDMPPLEDASDDDLGIIIPDASEVVVLASSHPYAYESDKMVPWLYDLDLKHKV
ncbi:hypothetical protein NL676_009983 [Syzygium grande]|nr:hypothetical protein NL676_009983 [Syzygium grande]